MKMGSVSQHLKAGCLVVVASVHPLDAVWKSQCRSFFPNPCLLPPSSCSLSCTILVGVSAPVVCNPLPLVLSFCDHLIVTPPLSYHLP